jgi:hypothetical protein
LMPGLECSWYKRRWFQQTLHGWAEAWRWVLGYLQIIIKPTVEIATVYHCGLLQLS